jgi:hypothetical protein
MELMYKMKKLTFIFCPRAVNFATHEADAYHFAGFHCNQHRTAG